VVPQNDFWIRSSQANDNHAFTYMLHDLKPGAWTSVDFDSDVPDIQDRVVSFCVPPGQGTIYLKLPSVIP
jgi:hypothetical protein